MAVKLIGGVENSRSLSNRYHLSKRSVQRYATNLRKKRAMAEKGGRPRVFDQASMTALTRYMSQPEQPPKEEIEEQFWLEQQRSWCRLHHTSMDSITEEFGPKKLSSRTVWRYLRKLNYKG